MRKISSKVWILVLAGIGVAALLFLAAGISNVDLVHQENYVLQTQEAANPTEFLPMPDLSDFLSKLGIIFSILVPLSIIYLIVSPEARKRFVRVMIPMVLMILALYFGLKSIQNAYATQEPPLGPQGTPGGLGDVQPASTVIPPFTPNSSPGWLIFIVSLGVVLLIALAIFWGWQLRRARRQYHPNQILVNTAQEALDDIRAGGDLRDVILRCYKEMNAVVSEKRAVVRPDYLTPSAFARKLETTGLPANQVQRLTRLFEAVRYGGWKPGPADEKEAIYCLEAVVDTLRAEA